MRSDILDSALGAFDESGLIGASIADVSRASATSVGGIYHHFAGKEGLAGAVYVACLQDFQGVFADAVGGDAEHGVRAECARCSTGACATSPPSGFLLSAGDSARGAVADELRDANRAFFARILEWRDPLVAQRRAEGARLRRGPCRLARAVMEYSRLRLAGRTRPHGAPSGLSPMPRGNR